MPERFITTPWTVVLAALEEDLATAGKGHLFDALKVYLVADQNAPPYAAVAGPLGMTEGAVKVAVHRLRQQYQRLIRAEVARTLGDPAEVEDEIRRLFQAVSL